MKKLSMITAICLMGSFGLFADEQKNQTYWRCECGCDINSRCGCSPEEGCKCLYDRGSQECPCESHEKTEHSNYSSNRM